MGSYLEGMKGLNMKRLLVLATLLALVPSIAAQAAEYYIDPNGSSSGAGTIGDPWSIDKLDNPAGVAGGDTIYLRGGTYYYPGRDDGQLGFRFDLRGDPNNKITVRPYQDERPVIDGGLTSTYRPDCKHVLLYGLEVVVSEWYDPNNWISTQSGSWPLDLDAPYGGIELGDGTGIDIVNCYIHHFNHNGIGWRDQNGYNATIHGTIIYLGGWKGPDRNHGHSVYGANRTGSHRTMDQSYCFEIMSSNMHVWGSYESVVSDITWRHNVLACHSDVTLAQTPSNFFGGANHNSGNLTIDENLFYMSSATFGYDGATSGGGHDYTVTDNTFIRGNMRFWEGTWVNVVTSGNVFWFDPQFSGRQYHDMGGLPEWTDPPIVDFHINRYDADRANLCLIQPTKYDPQIQPINNLVDGNDTISVDFSSWLSGGDVVEIKDARDLYGPAVFTFTYDGSNVDVPVATTGPIGTCKEFSLYVCFRAGNGTPTVSAGTDQVLEWPDNVATLDGVVTDDGNPPGSSVTMTWSRDSGPVAVTFADAGAMDTTATFSAAGTYVLKLTADDTERTAFDTVTIAVKVNERPIVDAGPNKTAAWPAGSAMLDGTVSDDGLPQGQPLSQTWSTISGPGTVTFANADAVDTAATFSTFGTYVLKLTADDTQYTASDTVTATYSEPTNQAPAVDAGSNTTIYLPANQTILDGTVSDDGLPQGQAVSQTWSTVSGPGTVTFASANAVDTPATFSTLGTYVLRLSATDTELTATDTVTITVQEESDTAAILFDMGSNNQPNAPETDGRYYNYLGRAQTPNAWATIVPGNAVDQNNEPTSVGLNVYDIANQNKNLARAGTYPFNVENDGWNYSSSEGSQAIIRITGLDSQRTYTLKIHSSWPSDPWWYASGKFTCQGTSQYYDDDGAVIYTWTNLAPSGGQIDLEMNTWLPAGQTPTSGSCFSIELIELIPGNSSTNEAPTVDAGPSRTIGLPVNTVSLDGTVSDDGLPTWSLTLLWSVSSGPGEVTFADDDAADTSATFSVAGTYVLQLYAFDGALSGSDQMTVVVDPANTAPTVDAGDNILLAWPAAVASLDGTVSDDGLPSPSNLTTTWTLVEGPAPVTFTDASSVDTEVTFTGITFGEPGQYVLRLTASDGELSTSDEVEVTVASPVGDFDGDGLITSDDVDLLYAVLDTTVPPTDPMYDLTGDGQVTMADAEYLVETVVGTSMADTNLDMEVDIMDLGNLADVYGNAGTFSDGDTNGDGVVGIMDLGNLADDYGKTYP